MFSFRTTSLEDQLDKALHEGHVGCFCTQNCWDTQRGRYMYDIFRERGNLQIIFNPRDTELTPLTNHIEFSAEDINTIDGVKISFEARKEWVHLRRSNTEPIIRIYAEAATKEAADALAQEIINIANKIIG